MNLGRWAALAAAGLVLAGPAFAAGSPAGLPAGVAAQPSEDGLVLVDAQGRRLYRLDLDRYRKRRGYGAELIGARCAGVCDRLWRPAPAPAGFTPGGGWDVVRQADGTAQLSYKGDPLYTFAGKTLEDATAAQVAPPYFSSYSAKPIEFRSGVPVTTLYWHEALYQPPAPNVAAPAGVALRWMKTAYVFAAGERPLYQSAGEGCAGACGGLTPLPAPLAALPVGGWRPVQDQLGRRCWSYRGRLVYAADAAAEPPGPTWRRLEAR